MQQVGNKSSVAESVARLQRGCLATTHQPIGVELGGHVSSFGPAVGVGVMRLSHVFLEVEIAAETSRADGTRERLDVAVRVHVERQVVHLFIIHTHTHTHTHTCHE